MLLIVFAAVFFGAYTSYQSDVDQLRRDLGVIRNCEISRNSRIATNEQRAVFHDYLVNQRKISNQEQPFLEPFFNQFGPELEKLLRHSRRLLNDLIKAEEPLPIPACTKDERPLHQERPLH